MKINKHGSLIVIPTHRTGIKFLDNLLGSFKGYNKYPIIVVVNDYKDSDDAPFKSLLRKYENLPVELKTLETNSFELGGLHVALKQTDYSEFFLLSHSCEINNPEIFDIIFDQHADRSVALGVQIGNWRYAMGRSGVNRDIILRYLDEKTNQKMLDAGNIKFWQGHIGKYRREILDKINIGEYLPKNMVEAISISEMLFTSIYHSLDPSTVILFPDWRDTNKFEEKFGKKRMKIENKYLIKWKTHWDPVMVFSELAASDISSKIQENKTNPHELGHSKKLDIIAVADGQREILKCFINSIKAQTNQNYRLVLLHDGINDELKNELAREGYLSNKVEFYQTAVRIGKYGHPIRRYALKNLVKNEYVILTNGTNYYAPTMVGDVLMRNEDFIYFNCIHSHVLQHVGNADNYGILDSKLQMSHIDMGCVAVRSSIAVRIGFKSDSFAADWHYFKEILDVGASTYKIGRFLMIRN